MSDFWDGKRVVVTGGAGMVGSQLTAQLLMAGAEVTVLDDFSRGQTRHPAAQYVVGDAGREGTCRDVFKSIFAVFNLAAAVAGVEFNQRHQSYMFESNLRLLSTPLKIAAEYGVERFLQTSSVCIYSPQQNHPCREEFGFSGNPTVANEGYSLAKRMGEKLAEWYAEETGIGAVIVRPSNIYGPCFSGDTDVLTTSGIKNIKNIYRGEKVYTLNPSTHEIEVAEVTAVQRANRTEEFINFRSKSVDFRVTPDHWMYYRTSTNYQRRRADFFRKRAGKATGQMGFAHHKQLEQMDSEQWASYSLRDYIDKKHVSQWDLNGHLLVRDGRFSRSRPFRTDYEMRDLVEFIGWYVTEGSITYPDKDDGQISIAQYQIVHPENCRLIADLLRRMRIPFGCDARRFYFTSRMFQNFIRENIGVGSRNKRIPTFVFDPSFPTNLRWLLFHTMMLGDGSRNGRLYTTASDSLKDDFFHLCFLLGIKATISRNDACWKIGIKRKRQNSVVKYRNISVEEVEETETFCFTASRNNIIYAGRNGKFNWVGQCDYFDERAHVIPALIRKCLDDDEIVVNGSGKEVREFIFTTDVARGMMAAAEHGQPGAAYNLGTNGKTCITVHNLMRIIQNLTNSIDKPVRWTRAFDGGDSERWSDCCRANEELDWRHEVTLNDGLKQLVDWYVREGRDG